MTRKSEQRYKKSKDTSQGIHLGPNAKAGTIIQAILQVRSRDWIISILILGVIGLFGFSISNFETIKKTFFPSKIIEPAKLGETLILVTDFEDRSSGKNPKADPAEYIYSELKDRVQQDDLQIRVAHLRQVVDSNLVETVGKQYRASMVLWGWYDDIAISSELVNLRKKTGEPSTEERARISLMDKDKYEFNITVNLPSHASYITFFALGVYSYNNDEKNQALKYLSSAIRAVPSELRDKNNPFDAFYLRGNIYYEMDNFENAKKDIEEAIQLKPDSGEAYNSRAGILFKLNQYEAAYTDFQRALDIGTMDDSIAHKNIGQLLFEQNKFNEAIQAYTLAIEIDPAYSEAYYLRSLAWDKLNNIEQSQEDMKESLSLWAKDMLILIDAAAARDEAISKNPKASNEITDYIENLDDIHVKNLSMNIQLAIPNSTEEAEKYLQGTPMWGGTGTP